MKLQITRFKNIKDGTLGKFELLFSGRIFLEGYTLEPAAWIGEYPRGLMMSLGGTRQNLTAFCLCYLTSKCQKTAAF